MKKIINLIILVILTSNLFAFTLQADMNQLTKPQVSVGLDLPYNTYIKLLYSEYYSSNNWNNRTNYYLSFSIAAEAGFSQDFFKESPVYLNIKTGVRGYLFNFDFLNFNSYNGDLTLQGNLIFKLNSIQFGLSTGLHGYPYFRDNEIFFRSWYDLGIIFKF